MEQKGQKPVKWLDKASRLSEHAAAVPFSRVLRWLCGRVQTRSVAQRAKFERSSSQRPVSVHVFGTGLTYG